MTPAEEYQLSATIHKMLNYMRSRATELRILANNPDHSEEYRRRLGKAAEEIGKLANEIERGEFLE